MIGNKLEQDIIKLYNQEITGLYSINEIASKLEKAYPYINKKVTALIKGKILKKTIVGRAHLCGVNLDNDESIFLLILNEIQKKNSQLEKDPKLVEVISRIHELRKVVTIHLVQKVRKRLIFVLETLNNKNILEKSTSLGSFHLEFYTKQEYLTMLATDKELLDEQITLHGFEKYYHYLKEIETTLKIKYSKFLK